MKALQNDMAGIAKGKEAKRREEEYRRKNKLKRLPTSAPKPPEARLWERFGGEVLVISFFWRWLAADRNPMFTPDGKAWLDQDPDFWKLIDWLDDTWLWAKEQAETP